MSSDVYQPCPCGSGKKLKFCCHRIASEMERITKLFENNQRRMAYHALEELQKEHPDNRWIIVTQASAFLDDERDAEALPVLEKLLRLEPDHAYGMVLYAFARHAVEGYERAKAAIQRSFQKCARSHPALVGELALEIALGMSTRLHPMAHRQYLTQTMRLAPSEEDQRKLFLTLLEYDGDMHIPYPLRSVHTLSDPAVSGEDNTEARMAMKLAEAGCWDAAARLYRKLAEAHPENADLWRNAGLCHAWDADEKRAAEALHRAASLQTDFEEAVESESLAQLLDTLAGETVLPFASRRIPVQSTSKFLTLLDSHEQFVRDPQPMVLQGLSGTDVESAGQFLILDRPPLKYSADMEVTSSMMPLQMARLTVFDRIEETGEDPAAYLFAPSEEAMEKATALLSAVLEDAIGEAEPRPNSSEDRVPRFLEPLLQRPHFPAEMPGPVARRVNQQRIEQFLHETWPRTVLPALNGRCPNDAIGDESLRVRLAAAINVLEAHCGRLGMPLDTLAMRLRFALGPVHAIAVDQDTSLSNLSAMQTCRLPVESLTDDQLLRTMHRAMLIQHPGFLYRVFKEVDGRPSCLAKTNAARVHHQLAQICQLHNRPEEAVEWVERGRNLPDQEGDAFQRDLSWDLSELAIRIEGQPDANVDGLVDRLWNYYGAKVPELREHIQRLLAHAGRRTPGESAEILTASQAAGGESAQSELWVPGAAPGSPPSGAQKLWLPGQD